MVDLNEVRMFVQVVRARSFAAAARRMSVPPNTLSRRIRQLESRLETRLMQRSTRKLTLTAAGQDFFDRCAASVDGIVQAGKDLADGETLRELTAHDCLTVSDPQSHVTWILRGPHGDDEVRVSGRFSANTTRLVIKACLSGLGIALLPTTC